MTEPNDTPADVELPEPDPDLVASRSRLTPEERAGGSDDAAGEAQAVLADSELRTVEVAELSDDGDTPDDGGAGAELDVERRTSAETVAPPGT